MKIYVVHEWDYDGNGSPEYAASTREGAKLYIAKKEADRRKTSYVPESLSDLGHEIVELELE